MTDARVEEFKNKLCEWRLVKKNRNEQLPPELRRELHFLMGEFSVGDLGRRLGLSRSVFNSQSMRALKKSDYGDVDLPKKTVSVSHSENKTQFYSSGTDVGENTSSVSHRWHEISLEDMMNESKRSQNKNPFMEVVVKRSDGLELNLKWTRSFRELMSEFSGRCS